MVKEKHWIARLNNIQEDLQMTERKKTLSKIAEISKDIDKRNWISAKFRTQLLTDFLKARGKPKKHYMENIE